MAGAVGAVVEIAKSATTKVGAVAQVVSENKAVTTLSVGNKAASAAHAAQAAYHGNIADALGEGMKTFSSGTGKAMMVLDAVPVVGELAQVPGHILAAGAYGAGALVQAANAAVYGDFKGAGRRLSGGMGGAGVKLVPFSEIADGAVTAHGVITGGDTSSLADRADRKIREAMGEGQPDAVTTAQAQASTYVRNPTGGGGLRNHVVGAEDVKTAASVPTKTPGIDAKVAANKTPTPGA
jgi:hypothetical protein